MPLLGETSRDGARESTQALNGMSNGHTKAMTNGLPMRTTSKAREIEDRLFINGEFVPSRSGRKFNVHNPTTTTLAASVYEAEAEDVDLAVEAAKAAFPAWSELDSMARGAYLEKWALELEKASEEMSYLDAISMGKPAYPDQLAHMGPAFARFFASKALDVTGDTSLNTANFINFSLRQPFGVCGAIIPWNASMLFFCSKAAAALIAGNTLVLKSSEKAPLSSLVAARCARDAGIPPGVLNVLSGYGRPCGEAIARHMDIRKISFTGSTATGRAIQKASAESNLKSVTLELGGKSPLIVFEDADLSKAVPAAAMSILMNSGQVCNASSRIYVHNTVASPFLEQLKSTMASMGKSGDPTMEGTTRGPQADKAQFDRVISYLEMAKKPDSGIKIVLGGSREHKPGYFIQPTILTSVPQTHKLITDEIFGPVVIVNTFTNEDDVLGQANDTEYGLYASVFTKDLGRAMKFAKKLQAGSVAVNCTSPTMAFDMPFGGWKSSGEGRELSKYALDYWTELKSVFVAL